MKKALYATLGCKLNFAETGAIATALERQGITRVSPGEIPDYCVVNTCSVTAEADRKCRHLIRSLHSRYPSAEIIVTGCYAQLRPMEAATIEGVGMVVGINEKLRIGEYLLAGTAPAPADARELRAFMPSCSRGDRTRYFLKVQDGCDYWCSYCTIPAARGRSRSASIESLTAQAREVAAQGGKEIVLTGVNIGDFGRGSGETFLDLLRALDAVEGIERYRIGSIEPNLLTDETIRFVAESRRVMPHFHIPLQCGADEVLALMRRRYDTALFAHKIGLIRSVIPHAFIGVDLITGARGETPELFEKSRAFVESLPISRLHVFPYSERPGTRALTDIDFAVAQEEKHRRLQVMTEVSRRCLTAFSAPFEGTVRPVLIEHVNHGKTAGFTDNYLRVELPEPRPELANRIVDVRLGALSPDADKFTGEVII